MVQCMDISMNLLRWIPTAKARIPILDIGVAQRKKTMKHILLGKRYDELIQEKITE